jgi:hypothetical protein
VLEECHTKEQCSVVRFLWTKQLNALDIHKEMFPLYGEKCVSCKVFHNWVEKFSQGHSKVADDARPGCPVDTVTEATVLRMEELIRAERRIKTDSIATAAGCSHGLNIQNNAWLFKVSESVHTVGTKRTDEARKN